MYVVHEIPAGMVGVQIDAVLNDIGADGVKTGMASNKEIIEIIVDRIKKYGINQLVIDPVMVAKSADRLLQKDAETSLVKDLLPVDFLVTSNVYGAEIISGSSIKNLEDAKRAAEIIQGKGPDFVLLRGGHLHEKEAADILLDGNSYQKNKGINA